MQLDIASGLPVGNLHYNCLTHIVVKWFISYQLWSSWVNPREEMIYPLVSSLALAPKIRDESGHRGIQYFPHVPFLNDFVVFLDVCVN